MADLPETPNNYVAGVYQLETNDPVQGGPNGIDNRQATQLGDRTRYLKDHVDAVEVKNTAQDGSIAALGVRVIAVEAGQGDDPGPGTLDYWWRS